jgi:D-glycerate 3-kinase
MRTAIPTFDKLSDDRRPEPAWPAFEGRPSAVLVDGWCLGATAQAEAALVRPVNGLEADEDPDGRWRRGANAALAGDYARFFAEFDAILFLRAPGFEVVLDWRCEQEAGLLRIAPAELPDDRRAALARFVAHYERLTRHMLEGGVKADATARLRPDRSVAGMSEAP